MSRRDEARKAKRKERQAEKRARAAATAQLEMKEAAKNIALQHERHVEKLAAKITRAIGGDIEELKAFVRREYEQLERERNSTIQRLEQNQQRLVTGEIGIDELDQLQRDEAASWLARSHSRDKEIADKWYKLSLARRYNI